MTAIDESDIPELLSQASADLALQGSVPSVVGIHSRARPSRRWRAPALPWPAAASLSVAFVVALAAALAVGALVFPRGNAAPGPTAGGDAAQNPPCAQADRALSARGHRVIDSTRSFFADGWELLDQEELAPCLDPGQPETHRAQAQISVIWRAVGDRPGVVTVWQTAYDPPRTREDFVEGRTPDRAYGRIVSEKTDGDRTTILFDDGHTNVTAIAFRSDGLMAAANDVMERGVFAMSASELQDLAEAALAAGGPAGGAR
jgi:hypothetical protein